MRSTLALLCAAVAAQVAPSQAPVAPPGQQPFRATTVVVEVDATVTGPNGQFVADVGPGDFEVLEDGKPQVVRHVYLVTDGVVSAPPAPPAAGAPAQPLLPPAAAAHRVAILFFDDEHIDPGAFKRLQSAAEEFLRTQFRDGDIGGVLVGGKMAGGRLTSDRNELMAAVRGAKPAAGRGFMKMDLQDWPRMTEVEAIRIAINGDRNILDQVVARADRETTSGRQAMDSTPNVLEKARYLVAQLRQPARRTLAAFGGVMNGLARIPGHKTVVFMSDGFFVEESGGVVRDIVGMAARANVRVYSIDAQGQHRRQPGLELSAMTPMETGGQVPAGAYDTTEDAPNSLAVDTGGFVVRNTNDFRGALENIWRDTGQYYVIGYTPANATMDGRFRAITVRVKRPGIRVRARKGYLATAGASPASTLPADTDARTGATAIDAAPPAPGGAPTPAPAPAAPPGAAATAAPTAGGATPSSGATGTTAAASQALRPDAGARVESLAARTAGSARKSSQASEGWERYSKGDLQGAERLLSQAAAEAGSPPWVWYALGFAQLGTGQLSKAIETWEHVRKALPEFETIWLDLADAYVQAGDLGRSANILREAAGRWPSDPELWNGLGTLQVRRGAMDEALVSFGTAVKVNPADALAYFNLARTHELRYYKMRRFSQPEARWVANPADLAAAIENYQRYLAHGGPYAEQARAALERLQWVK